jgi:predicted ATPase
MVLVGANSSGKSNFIKALQFLFSAMTKGLSKAIDEFGGYENICFRRTRRSKGSIHFAIKFDFKFSDIGRFIAFERISRTYFDSRVIFQYRFEFKAGGETIDAPYSVTHEDLKCQIINSIVKEAWFSISRNGNVIDDFQITSEQDLLKIFGFIEDPKKHFLGISIPSTELMVETLFPLLLAVPISNFFKSCRAYHLTPEEARKPVDPSGSDIMLDKFGGNLASVIRYFKREQPEDFGNLMEHARIAVASIKDVSSRYTDNKLLSYKVAEEGFRRPWLPEDVSDGTIQSLCLFLPLEDRRIKLAAYDEPENSVHPWIQEHFTDTCIQKATENHKQVILATHSKIIVDRIPPYALYMIERSPSGETIIRKAEQANPELRQIHDEKIMKVGEYWHSGALGGVPMQTSLLIDDEKENT